MTVEERIFFGQPGDFMTVRELTVRGTNLEIGQTVGRLAVERYGCTPERLACEPLLGRARRRYIRERFATHSARMRGVAAVFALDAEDDAHDLTGLVYLTDVPIPRAACSAVYYPPATTATGGGFLSRNYDFAIGTMAELMQIPLPPEIAAELHPIMSEPYVMVWYPRDGGYASVAIHAFDLLGGTLEGMNSEGLVVAILADHDAINELGPRLEPHPVRAQVVGVHELAVMRLVLDTCATAAEAKDALLGVKQYYSFMPLHYIVADRAGQSFVYENSTGRNAQFVIDGDGRPQVLTNCQIHKHVAPTVPALEALTAENETFWRQQRLAQRVADHAGKFSPEDMKSAQACVNIRALIDLMGPGSPLKNAPSRTVWHSLYDQDARSVEVSFYLGEDSEPDGTFLERRSEYLRFALDAE